MWFRYPDKSGGKWELGSAFLITIVGIAVANFLARRSLQQFRKALSIEDIPTARREHASLVDFWRRRGRETIKAYGINILLLEERYQEALDELQALDAKKLGKKGVPVIENHVALCRAHLGEPAKAIEISHSVLPQLEAMGPDYGSSAQLVLGVANFLLNRSSEAVPHLEKASAMSTNAPTRKARAAFYLGKLSPLLVCPPMRARPIKRRMRRCQVADSECGRLNASSSPQENSHLEAVQNPLNSHAAASGSKINCATAGFGAGVC